MSCYKGLINARNESWVVGGCQKYTNRKDFLCVVAWKSVSSPSLDRFDFQLTGQPRRLGKGEGNPPFTPPFFPSDAKQRVSRRAEHLRKTQRSLAMATVVVTLRVTVPHAEREVYDCGSAALRGSARRELLWRIKGWLILSRF